MLFQPGMNAVDHFADLRFFQGRGAYLVEDQPFGAGVVELVGKAGRDVDGLELFEMTIFPVMQSLHGALALDDEKGVIGAWMAVQLVIDAGLVTVERDVEPVGLGRTRVVTAGRLAPLRLINDVDFGNLVNFFHGYPPDRFGHAKSTGCSGWNT